MISVKEIFTIGYEGKSFEEFLQALKSNDIKALIDVRIKPHSRKAGFSKTKMSDVLPEEGIEYSHHKELGTPLYMMEEMKKNGHYDLEEYRKYLLENKSVLTDFLDGNKHHRIALMCFELKPSDCHRSIVADELRKKTQAKVIHL